MSGDTPYRTGLPPLRTRKKGSAQGVTGGGALPVSVFAAYRRAEEELARSAPETLPVPDGAVVASVQHRTSGRLVVATVVRGGFDTTLAFLHKQLPKAGYIPEGGEVEEDDAESNFSSTTVRGRWTLRKMSDCEGGVYLTSAVS
ncbi:hypothetical protein [Streptomyces sp. NPDC001275]